MWYQCDRGLSWHQCDRLGVVSCICHTHKLLKLKSVLSAVHASASFACIAPFFLIIRGQALGFIDG